jgi:threonylcarbamoyladenosine tRNA methylthiotransferase MtaB
MIALGCRLNYAESEAMHAAAAGEDDLIIVNSCAVTAEAVRQTRKAIKSAAARRPGARILVTGCAAELEPARFAAMPEVAGVFGNGAKASFPPFVLSEDEACPERLQGSRGAHAASESPEARTSTTLSANGSLAVSELGSPLPSRRRVRAFVEVQNGCDHRCTFCIIPYARGASRSLPAGAVVDRIKALVDAGCNEIVLTGVDTTSYGPDLPGEQTLGHLVERILKLVPALPRLRFSSLDSIEIDDRLFALITQEHRIQPHLHLSLQAGDDMILKRMKRRHSRAQAIDLIARLKSGRPEIAIGADLIAGFPTETEAQALNTLALLDEADIVHAHIFPYSAREGTPAARMPQHDAATIKARAARLRAAAEARRAGWLEGLTGTTQSILIERTDGRGHAGNYAPARLISGAPGTGNAPARGDVVAMRVAHVADGMLVGELA